MKIALLGMSKLGQSLYQFYHLKKKIPTKINIDTCLDTDIIFICLKTTYSYLFKQLDKSEILKICSTLTEKNYKGIIVIHSSVEPGTTEKLSQMYSSLKFMHSPIIINNRDFYNSINNRKNIIIGKPENGHLEDMYKVRTFFENMYNKEAIIHCSNSSESEATKIFFNSYNAVKLQLFNEFYNFCGNKHINYHNVKDLMIKNKLVIDKNINVPGYDKKLSFSGENLPNDITALNSMLKKNKLRNYILDGAIKERNEMRPIDFQLELDKTSKQLAILLTEKS
jgi:UDP-glucose 6-dehydrogenase